MEFCADEAAQGTRYVEVSFTAAAHGERLGDPEMPLAGLAEGRSAHGIEVAVLLDHSRRRCVDRARLTLRLAERYRRAGKAQVAQRPSSRSGARSGRRCLD